MRLDDGDYWIDDYGAWNHVAFGQLCPFFATPGLENAQRMDLAFRRLGMVRVSKRHGTVTVQWDISKACDESLDSACAFLWDLRGVERTKLCFYFGGWTRETFESIRDAFIRLEELRTYRDVTPFPEVRMETIGEGATDKVPTPIIQRAQRLLAENDNRLDSELRKRFADDNLLDRIVLFQVEDGGDWFSYRYIGRRSLFSQVFGTRALKDHIGKHCTIDPSENRNGHSVSRAYPRVMASGKAQIEQVLAPIRHAHDDAIWISYQRLMAPCSWFDNHRSVLLVLADRTEESLIAA